MSASARKSPCATCPYRRSVPSGVWHPDEYVKLQRYDRETWDQPVAVFDCHHGDGQVCAGWLGYGDPTQLLAVRIGISEGRLDPSVADYTTTVPLFTSGSEAAWHGLRDLEQPSAAALAAQRRITSTRGAA